MNVESEDVMAMVRAHLAGDCSFSALLSVVRWGVLGLNRGMFVDHDDHSSGHFARLERDEQLILDELATWFAANRAALFRTGQTTQQPTLPQSQVIEQSDVTVHQKGTRGLQTATARRPIDPGSSGTSSWQQIFATAGLMTVREMPSAPHEVSKVTMLMLLGYRAARFNFIRVSEADLNRLYYWPLINEGLIVEPKWIHDPRQKNKPFTNLVNTHGSAMARVVVAGEQPGSTSFGFGITTAGIKLFSGLLHRSGLKPPQLERFTESLAATVSVPADYRKELLQDPDSVPVI